MSIEPYHPTCREPCVGSPMSISDSEYLSPRLEKRQHRPSPSTASTQQLLCNDEMLDDGEMDGLLAFVSRSRLPRSPSPRHSEPWSAALPKPGSPPPASPSPPHLQQQDQKHSLCYQHASNKDRKSTGDAARGIVTAHMPRGASAGPPSVATAYQEEKSVRCVSSPPVLPPSMYHLTGHGTLSARNWPKDATGMPGITVAAPAAVAAAVAATAAAVIASSMPRQPVPPPLMKHGDMPVGIVYDRTMELHVGPEHYEKPQRIIEVFQTLQEEGLLQRCWQLVPRQATDEELLRAHSQQHLESVDSTYDLRPECSRDAAYVKNGADLYVCRDTATAARCAAGCCAEAVEQVMQGKVDRALAIVRPPGHHAECSRAMGFCFYNNVAVAARAALQQAGVQRVLCLDWDIHHGNGIQQILWEDPAVLYISIHRDPKKFYPFDSGFVAEVGEGPGKGFNVNLPWFKKGVADADYMAAFDLVVEPIISSYKPDLIIVAAGFDAADGDPLGGCRVTPDGYAHMTQRLLQFAGGRLVLALEGGYNCRISAECAAACVRVLLGEAAEEVTEASKLWPMGETGKTLRQVMEVQAPYWPVLAMRSYDELWDEYLLNIKMKAGKL